MSRPIDHAALAPARTLATPADYIALAKPRVSLLVMFTTLIGYLMARGATSGLDIGHLIRTLLLTGMVSSGTLALNMYLERETDARMRRTQSRPLPAGRMQPLEALVFGALLVTLGLSGLTLAINPLSGMVTAVTVVAYLFVYTPLKTRSALCTVAGAFPGALPPVTGWVAAGGLLGPEALALFGILFFWQLPHSLAIARLYDEDYRRAGIRLLPTVDPGGGSTGRQVVLNCLALMAAGLVPCVIGMSGWGYGSISLVFGGLMLWQGAAMALSDERGLARRLLLASYLYVPVVLTAMAIDRLP